MKCDVGRCSAGAMGSLPNIPGWVLVRNQDVKGYDLKADGKGFYEVCGEPATVAIKCNEARKGGTCTAFTYDENKRCGYLKYSSDLLVTRTGFSRYVREGGATSGR